MFAKMFKATGAEQLNLSKISAAWHSASWLWGLQPNYFSCSMTANCSACAMLASMGELEMWLADLHVVVHAPGGRTDCVLDRTRDLART
mgnify:CR=1 FL=1